MKNEKIVWGTNRFGTLLKEGDMLQCGSGNDTWITHVQFDNEANRWHRECDYFTGIKIGTY